MKLTGKRVLVTGASSGIGKEIALLFASEGADLAICYYAGRFTEDHQVANELVEAVKDNGGRAIAIEADITKEAQVVSMVDKAIGYLGGIDILVNSAGITDGKTPFLETTEAIFDSIHDVNLKGAFFCCKHVIPHMLKDNRGVIVNIGSAAGVRVTGEAGIAYTTSKMAVLALTQQITVEFGTKGIRANTICPGVIETRMNSHRLDRVIEKLRKLPAGRPGTPQEVAKLALFLSCDDSDYIHGEQILIDGGRHLKWSNL